MNNVISCKWRCTVLYKSLQILDAADRKKLFLITVLQSGLAFLDLAGVAAIGLVGALAVTGVQSAAPWKQSERCVGTPELTEFFNSIASYNYRIICCSTIFNKNCTFNNN